MSNVSRSVRAVLLAVIAGAAVTGALAGASDRGWLVPNTRAISLSDVQYSDDPVVPSRVVALRSSQADFDNWGPVSLYPVVQAPGGKLYYGFIRHFQGGTVGVRWIEFTFPEDFRVDPTITDSEDDAAYGDALVDSGASIPAGHYEAKWVVNGKLIDTGDEFTYPGFKGTN